MNVTKLELKMLNNIATSDFGDFYDVKPNHEDSVTWLFEAANNRATFTPEEKGVLSSLVKKELVLLSGMYSDDTIQFTELGVKVWVENK